MVKLGILFIVAAVVYLLVTIFSPNVVAPLGALFCPAGQKMTSETITSSYRPGETDMSNYYYCVDSDNRRQSEVTGQITLLTMGGFVILLLAGVAFTTIGAGRASRKLASANSGYVVTNSGTTDFSMGGNPRVVSWTTSANAANQQSLDDMMKGLQQGVIRFGGQEIHVNDLKSGNYQLNGQGSNRTLSETLKQLQDAHTQGLINDEEFQKLRQEALDKLI